MSLKKKYFKTKDVCKVTFRLNPEETSSAEQAFLVGDFNNWDTEATPMQQLRDGSFKVELELELGREYQFRYVLDNGTWLNDVDADRYAPTEFQDTENSVIVIGDKEENE